VLGKKSSGKKTKDGTTIRVGKTQSGREGKTCEERKTDAAVPPLHKKSGEPKPEEKSRRERPRPPSAAASEPELTQQRDDPGEGKEETASLSLPGT